MTNPSPLELRISNIQQKIRVKQTGTIDFETAGALEKLLGGLSTDLPLEEKRKNVQKLLGFTGKEVDGIFGIKSITRIELFLDQRLPEIPAGASLIVSKQAVDFIVQSEVSSRTVYNSKYKNPVWPKGESGITIGIGYDLGYVSETRFLKDWQGHLSSGSLKILKNALGLKGLKAQAALTGKLKAAEIPYEAALQVFYTSSLPVYAKAVAGIYPGIQLLPPDVQGALLSLVYNRGSDLEGSRRTEMKNIQQWVKSKNLIRIANEIRDMKRLWPDSKGLQLRRDREAAMVENARNFLLQNQYIFV